MTAIRTEKLRKEYKDVVAVEGLDLQIEEGELFSLLGVNGAGKTTTIKMLTTLTTPTSGDAYIFEHSIKDEKKKIKEQIDVSMQQTAVGRNLTVRENIEFYCEMRGKNKEETEAALKRTYEVFGLDKVEKKRAKQLSGGWQRKLSIALALVGEPKVLFLDEPTLGLDVIARRELWRAIEQLKGKMTIVLTTHYMEEAEALSDRIGIMKDGRLLFVGDKDSLFEKTGTGSVEDAFIKIVEEN